MNWQSSGNENHGAGKKWVPRSPELSGDNDEFCLYMHMWWSQALCHFSEVSISFYFLWMSYWGLIWFLFSNEQGTMTCCIICFVGHFLNQPESFCSNKWHFFSLLMGHLQCFFLKGSSGTSSWSSSLPDTLLMDGFCITLHLAAGMCYQNQERPTNVEKPMKAGDTIFLWQVN